MQAVKEAVQEPGAIATEIRTAVRHSAVYGLGNVLAKGIGFFMLPFYTHYLTPVDYGVLEILDLSMSLLGMFVNMGIIAALLRCYARAESETEKKKTISTAFIFVIASSLLLFLLGIGLVRPVSGLLFGPKVPSTYLLISFTSLVVAYISALPRTYLRALDAPGTLVTVDTTALFVTLALNIVFIAVLHTGLVGILLSTLIVGTLQAVVLSVWTVWRTGLGFKRAYLRDMVSFGSPLILANVALFALNFSDRFFLQHLRSLDMVGVYSVGYKIGFMINYLLISPFLTMWQSRMFFIQKQPDSSAIFRQLFVLYSALLTYAALGISILSPEIVRVMVGPKFSASQGVIPIVALAYVIWGIGYYVQVGMLLTSNTKRIGAISIGAVILNLILNYSLVSRFGMMGAAWATMLSFLGTAVAYYCFSQRVYPLSLAVGRVTASIILGAVLFIACRLWAPGSIWLSFLAKGTVLAVFPVLLWKFRMVSAEEAATVMSIKESVLGSMGRWAGSRTVVSVD
jgi:O-antigen/teichoic acid export membrane protein